MLFSAIVNVYVALITLFLLFRWVGQHTWWIALLSTFTPFFFTPILILLPLAVLIREPYLLVRLLIIAAIGAAWFGPYFLPKTSAAGNIQTLSIATLNADIYNTQPDAIEAWLRADAPDVMFMQEAPDAWIDEDMSARLKDLYPYSVSQEKMKNKDTKVFLSKYPIIDTSEFTLSFDRFIHQRIVVKTPLGDVAMYNIHLMPNYGDTPRIRTKVYNPLLYIALSYDETIRSRQIADLLSRLANEQLPYIVAGDFNTSDFSLLYGRLTASMTDSFREAGTGFGMTWPVASDFGLPAFIPAFLRIDYIWHSKMFQAIHANIGEAVGSDHFPVMTELILRNHP